MIWNFLIQAYESFKPTTVISINSKNFAVQKLLGEGGFSYVYLVKEVGSYGQLYALKRIRIQLAEQEERLRNEIGFHGVISHPNVIPLVDSCIIRKNGRITEGLLLLPFYKSGTVQDLIDKSIHGLPLSHLLKIAIGIIQGLRAFHRHVPPLSFRDLKPANILLNEEQRPILMDLGSVSPAQVHLTCRKDALAFQEFCAETVTAPFRAPELFDPPSEGIVDESCDIWALGCTLYTMAYKETPFDGSMTATISGKVHYKPGHNPPFKLLIDSLLQVDPSKRPNIDQVLYSCEMLSSSITPSSSFV